MWNSAFRRFLLASVLLVAGGISVSFVAAENNDSTPSVTNISGGASLAVGSWIYHEVNQKRNVGAPALLTLSADGTVLQSSFGTTGLSTAQGSWTATGDTSASFTLVSIRAAREEGVNGPVPIIQLIQGTIRLSDDGDAWTGEIDRVAIWAVTGWKHLDVPVVSIQATRISVGSEWPGAGTPVLGTPPAT